MVYTDEVVRRPPSSLTMFCLALAAVAVWSLSVWRVPQASYYVEMCLGLLSWEIGTLMPT